MRRQSEHDLMDVRSGNLGSRRITSNKGDLADWYESLQPADREFVRLFVLESGSLKRMTRVFEVSYPTVRARLDRIIEKISLNDTAPEVDPFISEILHLGIDGEISRDSAKNIIDLYKEHSNNDRNS